MENAYDVEPDEVRIDIASSGETEDSVNPPPYSSSSTPTIRGIRSVQVRLFSRFPGDDVKRMSFSRIAINVTSSKF